MASWKVAKGLERLIAQWKTLNPGCTVYTIGDKSHQGKTSDHNPNSRGFVCAGDFMTGKGVTFDELRTLAGWLISANDKRLKYLILGSKIWTDDTQEWRDYFGKHHSHLHVSVDPNAENDGSDWTLKPVERKVDYMNLSVKLPVIKQGDSDDKLPGYNMITRIQRIVGADDDGVWGPKTTDKIADWCDLPASKCKTLNEDIARKVLGLGR